MRVRILLLISCEMLSAIISLTGRPISDQKEEETVIGGMNRSMQTIKDRSDNYHVVLKELLVGKARVQRILDQSNAQKEQIEKRIVGQIHDQQKQRLVQRQCSFENDMIHAQKMRDLAMMIVDEVCERDTAVKDQVHASIVKIMGLFKQLALLDDTVVQSVYNAENCVEGAIDHVLRKALSYISCVMRNLEDFYISCSDSAQHDTRRHAELIKTYQTYVSEAIDELNELLDVRTKELKDCVDVAWCNYQARVENVESKIDTLTHEKFHEVDTAIELSRQRIENKLHDFYQRIEQLSLSESRDCVCDVRAASYRIQSDVKEAIEESVCAVQKAFFTRIDRGLQLLSCGTMHVQEEFRQQYDEISLRAKNVCLQAGRCFDACGDQSTDLFKEELCRLSTIVRQRKEVLIDQIRNDMQILSCAARNIGDECIRHAEQLHAQIECVHALINDRLCEKISDLEQVFTTGKSQMCGVISNTAIKLSLKALQSINSMEQAVTQSRLQFDGVSEDITQSAVKIRSDLSKHAVATCAKILTARETLLSDILQEFAITQAAIVESCGFLNSLIVSNQFEICTVLNESFAHHECEDAKDHAEICQKISGLTKSVESKLNDGNAQLAISAVVLGEKAPGICNNLTAIVRDLFEGLAFVQGANLSWIQNNEVLATSIFDCISALSMPLPFI